ncbi:hypothetical protein N0V91_007081 [Didymella pomorum]|uniref:Uncharacterized protein n=1 Tax=Didymella pomorum TaxID=749634 RepID=A0A9W9D552_9PLEO|nr:hypothetical protein N0V91_007081 [Didymella pomorum]
MELFGVKDALHADGAEELGERSELGDKDVEELEVLMKKMVAIKELGEGMGEEERKRFAAKAVNDILKEL